MRRYVLLVVALVGLVGAAVWGDCNCTTQDPTIPPCYTAFWTCETVLFRLVVPGEFFAASGTSLPPLITGWRIEKMDGTLVFQSLFPTVPLGAWYQMSWGQRDSSGNPVSAGFYRIVVQTTSAGEFAGFVQVVGRPCLFSCTPARLCSRACPPTCGTPYVLVERDESLGCGCSSSVFIQVGCGCP